MLRVRAATANDVPRLVEIHSQAYPVVRAPEFRSRRFTDNVLGPMDNLRVAEEGGVVVGHGFVHAMRVRFGDQWVPCGGIGSVGVALEARGRGVAGALVNSLVEVSKERRDRVVILYPFREAFYARHEFGRAATYKRLVFSAGAAPRTRHAYTFRRASMRDAEDMHANYMQWARGGLERTPAMWRDRLEDAEAFVMAACDAQGAIAGWISYRLAQPEPHGATVAHVTDFHAGADAARVALLAHLGSLRDQVHEVELDLAADDGIDALLIDGDRHRHGTHDVEHTLGIVAAGPMMRMHDLEALSARRFGAEGAIAIQTPNARRRMVVRGTQASLDDSPCEDMISLEIATLARIAFGGVRFADARACGLVTASSDRAAALAAAMFAIPPYFSYDPF